MLRPFHESRQVSRTAAIREQMTAHKTKLRVLLSAIIDLPSSMAPDHPLVDALAILKTLYDNRVPDLPITVVSPVAPCWSHLNVSPDRRKARYAFEAATLQLLRRSLRNGSVWIDHSLLYRSREPCSFHPTDGNKSDRNTINAWG